MFSSAVSQFSWTQERQSFVAQSVNKCEGNGRCWKEDSDRDNKGTVSTWTALHGPWHAVNMDQQTVSLHSFSWIESHVAMAMEHWFADLLYPWMPDVSALVMSSRSPFCALRFPPCERLTKIRGGWDGGTAAHPVRLDWNLGKMKDASYASSMQAVYQRMQKAVWFTPFLQCRRKL